MILGNSITYHKPAPELEWFHNWGMAASAPDKDYVAVLKRLLHNKQHNFTIDAYNESILEYRLSQESGEIELNSTYNNYDLVILRIGENLVLNSIKEQDFNKNFRQLIQKLKAQNPNATLLIVGPFWENHTTELWMSNACSIENVPFIKLSDLGLNISNTAWGLFSSPDVGSHPGDQGMEQIAHRIFNFIEKNGYK